MSSNDECGWDGEMAVTGKPIGTPEQLEKAKKTMNPILTPDQFQYEVDVLLRHDPSAVASAVRLRQHNDDMMQRIMALRSQLDMLATFILSTCPGEPSQSQGAVETSIRIIKQLQDELAQMKGRIYVDEDSHL